MSEREMAVSMLGGVPDSKLKYIIAFIQGLSADEAADDAFCEKLWENYQNDPDPEKDEGTPLAQCLKDWGIV